MNARALLERNLLTFGGGALVHGSLEIQVVPVAGLAGTYYMIKMMKENTDAAAR